MRENVKTALQSFQERLCGFQSCKRAGGRFGVRLNSSQRGRCALKASSNRRWCLRSLRKEMPKRMRHSPSRTKTQIRGKRCGLIISATRAAMIDAIATTSIWKKSCLSIWRFVCIGLFFPLEFRLPCGPILPEQSIAGNSQPFETHGTLSVFRLYSWTWPSTTNADEPKILWERLYPVLMFSNYTV